ncbi:hypothetical protein GQ42DRAFT_151999 [Ramicandelaber brevisporus]|nr:hypothetical protein GQ42DRAFT_151999 [Ramicandelaber brevisporus]
MTTVLSKFVRFARRLVLKKNTVVRDSNSAIKSDIVLTESSNKPLALFNIKAILITAIKRKQRPQQKQPEQQQQQQQEQATSHEEPPPPNNPPYNKSDSAIVDNCDSEPQQAATISSSSTAPATSVISATSVTAVASVVSAMRQADQNSIIQTMIARERATVQGYIRDLEQQVINQQTSHERNLQVVKEVFQIMSVELENLQKERKEDKDYISRLGAGLKKTLKELQSVKDAAAAQKREFEEYKNSADAIIEKLVIDAESCAEEHKDVCHGIDCIDTRLRNIDATVSQHTAKIGTIGAQIKDVVAEIDELLAGFSADTEEIEEDESSGSPFSSYDSYEQHCGLSSGKVTNDEIEAVNSVFDHIRDKTHNRWTPQLPSIPEEGEEVDGVEPK